MNHPDWMKFCKSCKMHHFVNYFKKRASKRDHLDDVCMLTVRDEASQYSN